jgi:predicted permease
VYADISGVQEPILPVSEAATAELLRDHALGPLRVRVSFLLASVLFVVLLGALSVSNLLLGRLADRDHEMGVRLSLGATRGDLIRLIAIEATLLASAGGIIGVLLGRSGLALMKAGAPVGIPRLASATISPAILVGVAGLTAVVALVVLALPAWGSVSDPVPGSILRISGSGQRRTRSRRVLILSLSQMTIATVLLIGSTLMLRSLYSMATVDLGFDPDGIVAARIQLPATYWSPARGTNEAGETVPVHSASPALAAELDRFRQRLSAIPDVEAVSFAVHVPLSGSYGWRGFVPEGQPEVEVADESALVNGNLVDERFFDVLDVSLVDGRSFHMQDRLPGAQTVAIVSDRLAARYWPGQSAVGKRFQDLHDDVAADGRVTRRETWVEVVGTVAGLRERSLEQVDASVYLPRPVTDGLTTRPTRDLAFFVSTVRDDPAAVMPAVRGVVNEVFPGQPLRHFAPMRATIDGLMTESVFYTTLLGLFAAYGLVLSLVGIIGVIQHQISRRQHEMAVRITLGALPREVLGLLGRDTALTAAGGITIGLVIGAGLARLIESMLFDIVPLDPWTFAAIPLVFITAAVAAAVVPGRRIGELKLVEMLRAE